MHLNWADLMNRNAFHGSIANHWRGQIKMNVKRVSAGLSPKAGGVSRVG